MEYKFSTVGTFSLAQSGVGEEMYYGIKELLFVSVLLFVIYLYFTNANLLLKMYPLKLKTMNVKVDISQ